MLVHACTECDTLSINRIAADDDPQTVFGVFQSSLSLDPSTLFVQQNILILRMEDAQLIQTQLYGLQMEPF